MNVSVTSRCSAAVTWARAAVAGLAAFYAQAVLPAAVTVTSSTPLLVTDSQRP
jgi:hypothetical protein